MSVSLLPRRRPFATPAVGGLMLACLVLAACGTGKPAASPYSCGTGSGGHCYGIDTGPPSVIHPGDVVVLTATGVSMLMNTINPGSSGSGDVFFSDETWLLQGFNELVGWVEAGQLDDRFGGLRYFWAEMFIPQSRDFHDIVFIEHDLGPVSSADATAGTFVDIRRTEPDRFAVRVLASEHSFSAQAENFMWTRAKDVGDIEIGLELAGTTGAFAPPVSMHPRYWDATGVRREWTLPSSEPTPIGLPADPPIQAGWLTPPGPSGATWLTSCCTPAQAMTRASAVGGPPVAAVAVLAVAQPTTPPEAASPIDKPPMAPVGVATANQDLIAHPDSLPQAVLGGLLGKIGATVAAVTGSGCDIASAAGQQLPGPSTAGLDSSRPVCWFKFSGNFGVAAPKTRERASTTIWFDAAYAVFDAQSHNLLSAGAFQPRPGP